MQRFTKAEEEEDDDDDNDDDRGDLSCSLADSEHLLVQIKQRQRQRTW